MQEGKKEVTVFIVPYSHWDVDFWKTFDEYKITVSNIIIDAIDLIAKKPDFRFTINQAGKRSYSTEPTQEPVITAPMKVSEIGILGNDLIVSADIDSYLGTWLSFRDYHPHYITHIKAISNEPPAIPLKERTDNFKEMELSFSPEEATREAERCMKCGYRSIDQERCIGCGVCLAICPQMSSVISMESLLNIRQRSVL